jgi:hypothetical protein
MGTRIILTPNGNFPSYDDGFVATGTTNKVTAVNDSSDATFIRKPASSSAYYIAYRMSTTTLSGAIPWRVRACVRGSMAAGGYFSDQINGPSAFTSNSQTSSMTLKTSPRTVSNRARAAGVATLTTSVAHGYVAGDLLSVTSVAAAYNGICTVLDAPTTTTLTYAIADQTTEAAVSSSGSIEQLGFVSDWVPIRWIGQASETDQQIVDGLELGLMDSSESSKRAIIYRAFLELETTTAPSAGTLSVGGVGGSVSVSSASQSGTTLTLTTTGASFAAGDLIFVSGATGLGALGSAFVGTVTGAPTSTSVPVTVSTSATIGATPQTGCVAMPRVTATANPIVGWTYTQADGIPQYGYEVALHSAATATPGSGASLLWSSGAVRSSATIEQQIGLALTNATTYWVYVRVRMRGVIDGFSGADLNTDYFSAWNLTQLRMDISPPTAPTMGTPTWTSVSQAVSGTLTPISFQGGSGTQLIYLERSSNAGSSWSPVRGFPVNAGSGTTAINWVDYEAPRSTAIQYRAYSVGTFSGNVLTSAFSTGSLTTSSDSSHWLKDPLAATRNRGSLRILADPSFTVEEQLQVLRPLGRTSAVVVAGAIGSNDGQFSIHASSQAEWDALSLLLFAQRTLLWQDAYDRQRYIRIISRSFTRVGARGAARFEAEVGYVEVAEP